MTTTAELRHEHRLLLAQVNALVPAEPLSPADAAKLRARLATLGKQVSEHFVRENDMLDRLCNAPEGSAKRVAGETRRREADALAEACASFAKHWGRPDAIERQVGGYASALAVLRGALERLIRREEDEIYPLTSDAVLERPVVAPPETGFRELDDDHNAMFAMIGGLRAAIGGGRLQVDGALVAELAAYVEVHFQREEAIMEATAFPGIEDHRREHHLAKSILMGFRNDHLDGRRVGAVEVLQFLERWLSSHISEVDMRMVEHARRVAP